MGVSQQEYMQNNLRVLTLAPLLRADINDLDTLEVVLNLTEIYARFQERWLVLQPFFAPGRES
jgi:hypothetical protein